MDELNEQNATQLYQGAFETLFKLQSLTDINQCDLPSYDVPLLQRELTIFHEWFLGQNFRLLQGWGDTSVLIWQVSPWGAVRFLQIDAMPGYIHWFQGHSLDYHALKKPKASL